MAGWFERAAQALAMRRRQWRRERNARKGRPQSRASAPSARWIGVAGALAAMTGAAVIAGHARYLGAASQPTNGGGARLAVDALQPAAPGAAFTVPAEKGVTLSTDASGSLVIATGMPAGAPVRVDLCSQMRDNSRARLLPVRIGYQFGDVARLVERSGAAGKSIAIRNVALASPQAADMPRVQIDGAALPDFEQPLQLSWQGADGPVRWASDAGPGKFRREGWVVWDGGALRVQRRASSTCRRAGELVLQVYREGGEDVSRALVTAFPRQGSPISTWLAPGSYTVPHAPRASLEDQALFQQLTQHGLVRLAKTGLIEVAPRDLAAWQQATDGERSGELTDWEPLGEDASTVGERTVEVPPADDDRVRLDVDVQTSGRAVSGVLRSCQALP